MDDKERHIKVSEVKEQIERGTYTVDPRAVADAILQRLRELIEAREASPRAA